MLLITEMCRFSRRGRDLGFDHRKVLVRGLKIEVRQKGNGNLVSCVFGRFVQ